MTLQMLNANESSIILGEVYFLFADEALLLRFVLLIQLADF